MESKGACWRKRTIEHDWFFPSGDRFRHLAPSSACSGIYPFESGAIRPNAGRTTTNIVEIHTSIVNNTTTVVETMAIRKLKKLDVQIMETRCSMDHLDADRQNA
jgi:hypothetical protein